MGKGTKNLIPESHKLTVEEQSRGGKASAESRRRKKATSELAKILLSIDAPNKMKEQMKKLGISDDDLTNGMAVVVSLFQQATKGNVQAARLLMEREDASPPSIEEEQPDLLSIAFEKLEKQDE